MRAKSEFLFQLNALCIVMSDVLLVGKRVLLMDKMMLLE